MTDEIEKLREECKQRIYRVLHAWQQAGLVPINAECDDADREMQEARDAVDRLAALAQRSQREPLSEAVIRRGMESGEPEEVRKTPDEHMACFVAGARWAEEQHGIKSAEGKE